MPNFNFKSQLPIADLVNAIQKKPVLQAQIDQMQAEQKQARLKSLLDALSTGAQISRSMSANKSEAAQTQQTQLQNQQLQQQNQGQSDLGNLLQAANAPSVGLPQTPAPTLNPPTMPPGMAGPAPAPVQGPTLPPVQGPMPGDPNSPAFGTTPGYKTALQAALLRANPSAATSAFASQLAPKSLDQIMAEKVASGDLGLGQAAALKNSFNPQFNISTDPTTGLRQAVNTKNPNAPPINIDGGAGVAPQPGLPGMPPSPAGVIPAPPVPAKPPTSFNPKQIEYIGQAKNDFMAAPEVKESQSALDLVNAAQKALQSNNPANITNLRIAIARTSGVSPGSLTTNEITGEAGSKSLGAKSERYITQLMSGKLSATDIKDFQALLDDRKASAQSTLAQSLQDHADSFAAVHPDIGSDRTKNVMGLQVRRYLQGYSPQAAAARNSVINVSSEAAAEALPKGTRFSLNGRPGTVH